MRIVEALMEYDEDDNIIVSSYYKDLPKRDRRNDPGVGAIVTSPTVRWHANRDILVGEEDYFSTCIEEYGGDIPSAEHYDETDRIVRYYVNLFGNMNETTVVKSDLLFRRLYRIVGDFSSLFDDEADDDEEEKIQTD